MLDLLQKTIAFIQNPQNDFAGHTAAFLQMCVYAIVLAVVISLPLGILVTRRPIASLIAINLSGLGRAIPTIAFLLVVLPYLGTGLKPAVVALTVLGIPPILLNTIAGMRGVDPAAVDAARGMGMTRRQILTRVELPLVLPVVAAGVRTSAVQIVATAPLGALIFAGGYGDYILNGIYVFDTPQALAGAIPVALLALFVEFGLAGVERAITPAGIRRGAAAVPGVAESTQEAPANQPIAA